MRKTTLVLGEQEYVVPELPRKQNAQWRAAFEAAFVDAASGLTGMADVDISGAEGLETAVRGLMGQINGAVDTAVSLLFQYADVLSDDAGRIEERAYDSEIVDAFVAVLGLAYPFGSLLTAVGGMMNGLPRA